MYASYNEIMSVTMYGGYCDARMLVMMICYGDMGA